MKTLPYIFVFLLFFAQANTQDVTQSLNIDTSLHQVSNDNNKRRLYLVSGVHIASYAGTIYILGQTWYKNYPKTSFHTFNDSREWLQVDKAGHAWTAYNIAKYSKGAWNWAGVQDKKAVLLGGISSIAFQTILEYFDAHSAQWGWSWADMGANFFGTGLYVGQELLWQEQKAQFKFSGHKVNYTEALDHRADDLFGKTMGERILKDYNGQTYWLSFNLKSLMPAGKLPEWLNLAVGNGADGLFGGFENIAKDANGNVTFERRDIERRRQWYLSPDIDFTKIKTNKKGVRTFLSVLNMIKVPAPTVEFSKGRFKLHALYF